MTAPMTLHVSSVMMEVCCRLQGDLTVMLAPAAPCCSITELRYTATQQTLQLKWFTSEHVAYCH